MIECCDLPDDVAEQLASQARQRVAEDGVTELRLLADRCVEQTVRASGGNMSEAARRLGISRNTLYRKLRDVREH